MKTYRIVGLISAGIIILPIIALAQAGPEINTGPNNSSSGPSMSSGSDASVTGPSIGGTSSVEPPVYGNSSDTNTTGPSMGAGASSDLTSPPTVGADNASGGSCPEISGTLGFGASGAAVLQLQKFFIAQGLLSSGSATGYFGFLTQGAVQQWQSSHGLVSSGSPQSTGYGFVGARTRAAIVASCGGSPMTSASTTSSSSNSSELQQLMALIQQLEARIAALTGSSNGTNGSATTPANNGSSSSNSNNNGSFSATPSSGGAPLTVTFTATGYQALQNGSDYVIQFGDNSSGEALLNGSSYSASHTYTSSGTYTATLYLETNICGGVTTSGCVSDLQVGQASVNVGKSSSVTSNTTTSGGVTGGSGLVPSGNPKVSWTDLKQAAGYQVVGTGDFNHDGKQDVLFQGTDGTIGYWSLTGGAIKAWTVLGNAATYHVATVADFNGDGTSDILFENGTTGGDFGYWTVNPNAVTPNNTIPSINGIPGNVTWVDLGNLGAGYSIIGAADISGDGIPDIVAQNGTGDVGYFHSNSSVSFNWIDLGSANGFHAVALADMNGDGRADIIFQNPSTGEVGYWVVNPQSPGLGSPNSTSVWTVQWTSFGASQAGWTVVGAGSIKHNGVPDIVFQNAAGEAGYRTVVNGVYGTWYDLGSASPYVVKGLADLDGDGMLDILFQSSANTDVGYWHSIQ